MSFLPTLGSCSAVQAFPKAVEARFRCGEARAFNGKRTKGFVSHDAHLSVVFKGVELEVLRCKNNERLAAWTFSPSASAATRLTSSGIDNLSANKPEGITVGY